MNLRGSTSPLADGRDVVVYPRGASWGFRLPNEHTITVDKTLGSVQLAAPSRRSGYRLDRIVEADGEVRVYLGFPLGGTPGAAAAGEPPYAFPVIHDELELLEADLDAFAGDASDESAPSGGYGAQTSSFEPGSASSARRRASFRSCSRCC